MTPNSTLEPGYRPVLVREETKRALQRFRFSLNDHGRAAERRLADAMIFVALTHNELYDEVRDRFGVLFRLEYYKERDLLEIVRRAADVLGVEADEEGAREIARRARGTPRIANRLLKRVRDFAQVRADGKVTGPVAREALAMLDVDELGLDRIDRVLLSTIIDKFDGGPVGLSTLAVALGEESDTVEDVYEPYLLQLGFIQRTPRGRIVTKLGREHVGAAKAEEALF